MNDFSSSSIWQSSAAVEMANSAIDNARRAAASSRSKRSSASPSSPGLGMGYDPSTYSTNQPKGVGASSKNSNSMDLCYNDNAFSVIATLVTARLIPRIHVSPNSSNYTITDEDVAFFQKMLPSSVRRSFVDALRYRLQLLKSGVGSQESAVGKLTMQCQLLGLDRENMNLLLVLDQSSGVNFPINYSAQSAPTTHDQFINHDTRQDYNTYGNERGDNGVSFGLKTPMEFSPNHTFSSPNNTFSPRNNTNTFSPRSNNNTFSPRNNTNTFSPRSNTNTFSPRSNTNTFSPTNSTFSPRNNNALNSSMRSSDRNLINTDHNNDWDTPTESLARRQLIAEINETKFLMRDSVTPDAINFWKKHLDELDQRLVALSLEEELKADGSTDVPKSKVNNICTLLPELQSQDERRDDTPLDIVGETIGWTCQPSSPGVHHSVLAESHNVEITPYTPRNELPVCEVVAPSDLPGGYMFEAQLGTKKFLATVPPGGVIKNQIFTSTVRELESIEIPVPLGAWRDGAMDCFTDGVFHSLFLNALFVPCIALGQIMTRAGLDWRGRQANKLVSSFSCMNMTVLLMFWLAMNISACFMIRFAWEQGHILGVEYYGPIVLFDIFVWMYMVCLTKTVRGSIRNKYQIPDETCGRMQDCMCASFCMPCTICQMGRHTADFDTYRASCCSSTGLPKHVELAPVTTYEDQYQNMNDEHGHVV